MRNAPEWFPAYSLVYAAQKNFTIVNADYRLRPEVTGVEIVGDVAIDLWDWVVNKFPTVLAASHPGVRGDLTRVLSMGTSAGMLLAQCLRMNFLDTDVDVILPFSLFVDAYPAAQFALTHPATPNQPGVTALLLAYPALTKSLVNILPLISSICISNVSNPTARWR